MQTAKHKPKYKKDIKSGTTENWINDDIMKEMGIRNKKYILMKRYVNNVDLKETFEKLKNKVINTIN